MSPVETLLAVLVVTMGATVQGSVGFGLGMLAAPLLRMIDPILVPGPLLVAALLLTLLIAHRERRAIDLRGVAWAVAGRVPGTLIGATIFTLVSPRTISILVGGIVLLGVASIATGIRARRTRATLVGAGLISGITGTLASIGGPPMAMMYHDATGSRLRGTLSSFFIAGLILSIAALAVVGRFRLPHIVAAAGLLPGAVVGFYLSTHIAPILDRGQTRRAVLGTSAIAGVSLLVRALM